MSPNALDLHGPPAVAPTPLPAATRSVSFVLPNGFDLGGVTTWSLRLAEWLRARGYEVSLLSHDSEVPGGIGPVPPGVTLRPVDAGAFVPHDAYVRRFVGAYADALPGVVVPNYSLGAFAAVATLARERPSDLRVLGFAHTDHDDYYDNLVYYEPMVHAFVAVSETVGRHLRERLPHRADDIVVRPYAIPPSPSLVRSYSPPSAPLRLAYGGRLERRQKRVLDLAALAGALHARGVPFRLDVAGGGPAEQALRARIAALPAAAAASIHLHGQMPSARMRAFWGRADLCVMTSAFEGTSISMLEAMGQGCVPVVTAVSGTEMVLRPGENGYTAPVGDIEGLASHVARLAADRDLLARLGQAAAAEAALVSARGPYVDWAVGLLERVWAAEPRPWPEGRALQPPWYPYHRVPYPVVLLVRRISGRLTRSPRLLRAAWSAFRAVARKAVARRASQARG